MAVEGVHRVPTLCNRVVIIIQEYHSETHWIGLENKIIHCQHYLKGLDLLFINFSATMDTKLY